MLGLEVLAIVLVYMSPSIIACSRKHKDSLAVFLTNILFGWTGIGWGIALIWAVKK